jgi:hypothetical protein
VDSTAAALNRIADALFRQAAIAEKSYKLHKELVEVQTANLAVTKQLEAELMSKYSQE